MTLKQLQKAISDGRVSVAQVAEICGVTQRAVYYWISETKPYDDRYRRLLSLTLKASRK